MNKTIWALAFVVLCSGMAFAISNATTAWVSESKYDGLTVAGNDTTEGGNVTGLNLSTTESTESWAGYYGNVTGTLVLAEQAKTNFMYQWTYSTADGGEVCASLNSNPTWSGLVAAVLTDLATAWNFAAAADNVTETFDDGAQNFDIAGLAPISAQTADTGGVGFYTGALTDNAAGTAQTDFIFCAKINGTGQNYDSVGANYELIVPTDNGIIDEEIYFFYVELV